MIEWDDFIDDASELSNNGELTIIKFYPITVWLLTLRSLSDIFLSHTCMIEDDATNKNKHLRRMRSSLTINNACWHTASGVWIIFSRLFFSLRVFCVFIKIAFIRCAVLVKRIKNLSKWSTCWERNISLLVW